jgi:hypothetical protein
MIFRCPLKPDDRAKVSERQDHFDPLKPSLESNNLKFMVSSQVASQKNQDVSVPPCHATAELPDASRYAESAADYI